VKFRAVIESGNAAFSQAGYFEVARIVRELADHIEARAIDDDGGALMDYNGNKVGTWNIERQDGEV